MECAAALAAVGTTKVVPFPIRLACSQSIGADGAAHRQVSAAAEDGDVFPAAGFRLAGQEAPGFAVFLVLGFPVPSRVEMQRSPTLESLDRNDIPNVLLGHMRRHEVDILLGVASPGASSSRLILPSTMVRRTFYLDSPKSGPHPHQYVVVIAVAPRFGDAEIVTRRTGDEFRFRR